jgi:Tol biopolymer transport system component
MPDGRIIFDSWASEKYSTLAMEPGGAGSKQLASNILVRAISNDGNSLIFSKVSIDELWSMDLRTGIERLLLPYGSAWVDFTPDDKWIVFTGSGANGFGLVKMPVDGGEPTQISQGYAICPAVSPDGKMVAFTGASVDRGIGLVSIDGGNIIRKFEVRLEHPEYWGKEGALQWTPDGKAINYVALNNGVSNIWRQPIDGGPPVQITKFETGRIFNFAYSRDGKQLALSRGTVNSDVVLIKNAS